MISSDREALTSVPPHTKDTKANSKRKRPKQREHIRKLKGHELFKAAKENKLDKVQSLLEAGAYLNACENSYCALHWAVEHKNSAMVKLLLHHGADPMLRTINGLTPIQISAKNDSGEILYYLINKALEKKAKHQRDIIYKRLSDMGVDSDRNVIIAFAEYLFNGDLKFNNRRLFFKSKNQKSYADTTTIDIRLLLHHVFRAISKKNQSHQKLCYTIASQLIRLDNMDEMVILFLTLAGRYKNAIELKKYYYMTLANNNILVRDKKLTLSRSNFSDGDSARSTLINLANKLEQGSRKNVLINNELGMIYELLGNDEKAYQYYKTAAWSGSLESLIQLANFAKKMPHNKAVLAKYIAMCYYLGVDDKTKNNNIAVKYLNIAISKDQKETFCFLKRQGKKFAHILLTNNALLEQLNFDFAVKLFSSKVIREKLNKHEKMKFLIYCAEHHPTHKWVRRHPYTSYISQEDKKSLSEDLINTYLIMMLLNADAIPKQAEKYIKYLTIMSQDKLLDISDKFYGSFEPERIDRVRHIIQLYQYIVAAQDTPSEYVGTAPDLQDYYQLINLLEISQENKKRYKIRYTVQQVALTELSESLKYSKDSEENKESKERIKCAMKDPLIKNHHTFFCNPSRIFRRTKAIKELKHLLDEEVKTLKFI
jgi:hypothetical protein